ncbi:MAG: triosephosphate isomerase [Patiriisocius sp.]|jgi:triosephosphate isomerase
MSRLKIIAGNWKMNLEAEEARALYSALSSISISSGVEVVVAPPAVYLSEFASLKSKGAKLAAQNCATEDCGAYTGEYSAGMLRSIGLDYVILGHSERRALFHESNELVGIKVKQVIKQGLKPIFCCGELLDERERNEQETIVENQMEEGLFNLTANELSNVVIAYEPVWAIGTGKTASAAQAQEMHAFIRNVINKRYGDKVGAVIPILYGGSVNPGNAESIFSEKDVDGGLIGGASLKLSDFTRLIEII